ncbi:MAG: TldD/PmbA family protein [Candidatus Bathyarchaeota archaeon]|nr:TldD/PmbA family protein [Candidatus Bathyarchaeota archaeon]
MGIEANWNLLRNSVHNTVEALDRKSIEQAEAFYTCTETTEASIRNSEILTQNRKLDSGVGFRVVLGGNRVGFACTNAIKDETVRETGGEAFDVARVSSGIPNFALAESSKLTRVKGMYDSRVPETRVEEVLDIAQRSIASAENFDKRVRAKDGQVIFESGWVGVLNTLGVDCEERVSKTVLYLGGNGEENGEVTGSCYDVMFSRKADLDPEKIGESLGRKVVQLFKPKRVENFQGTVILGSEAVSTHMAQVLIDALRGDNVASGKSAWTGKAGDKVASERLTVSDNPLLEEGFASRSFDDEGCASQKTILVRKGELTGYLHNATTSKTLGETNTGNASRSTGGFNMVKMIIGDGYRALPIVYPSNLVVQPGEKTKEQLVSETNRGVLVESMAGFPQTGSGMVSAQLSNAFMIENGQIQYPIKGGMVSGVAFDWLRNLSGIGIDAKKFQNMIVPSLRIEGVKVVGA